MMELLAGTPAAVRAEAMINSALESSATRRAARPPVGEPEGMPNEAPIQHTVHSSTVIALTGQNPEAICLSLVTV